VRRASCWWLWRFGQRSDFELIAPLVRDPRSQVRAVALGALAHGPAFASHPDVVPLLLERACHDESLRVRRQAVGTLAWKCTHRDLVGFFRGLLETETDPKLRHWARLGIARAESC
jgi:HEAT repeat protein